MTQAVRLCVLAGLSFSTAMMTADASAADASVAHASAQGCPAWLNWACRDSSASSNKATRKDANTAIKGIRKEKRLSQAQGAAAEKPKQTQALKPGRPAPNGQRPPLNEQEKKVLFEQFLEWKEGGSQNTETNR
jgi:hypothetical protein